MSGNSISRSHVVELQWVMLAACTAISIVLVTSAWRGITTTIRLLDHVGWSIVVRRPATQSIGWLAGCWLVPTCPSAFITVWTALAPIYLAIAWAGLAAMAALAHVWADHMGRKSDLPPGSARWANRNEMRVFIHGERTSPQRGYLGMLAPIHRRWWMSPPPVLRLPERLRCSHCLVVGGSGARKTTGYHKPNVLLDAMDGVSVVIFDLKYPDPKSGFWDCVPYFARRGHDVQLFLPFDRQTLALPLLGDVRTLEDAYDIVDLLLPPPLQDNSATFYRDQERQLLVGLLLGVVRDHLRTPSDAFVGTPSLRRLFRLCLAGIREIERYVHTHPDSQVREAIAGLFELEDRLLAGIAAGVAGRLQIFNDDRLDRATSLPPDPRLEVRLAQLGTAPTLLYVGMPQERVQGARGQLVLQLVKRAVDRALLQTADRCGGALPVHVSVYLDDLAAMGPLPNVSEMMATMRSRRVAYHLSLQNRAHGELLYGPTGFRSFFVNNIQTVIIFPRYLKFDDAAYFSEMLGFMTVEQRSMGLTRRGWLHGSRTNWSREGLRPLLPPEEYPDWPEPMGILFAIGARPARVLLPRVDEHRVAGIRNPLHRFHPYLAPGGDELSRGQQVTALIRTHLSWVDAHRATSPERTQAGVERRILTDARGVSAEGDRAPTSTYSPEPTVASVNPTPDTPGQTLSPEPDQVPSEDVMTTALVPTLRQWANDVIERPLPPGAITAYYHNGRLTRMGVLRGSLPPDLAVPESLGAWIAHRWVRVSQTEIGVLPRALRLLSHQSLTALRRAGSRGRTERRSQPTPPQSPTALSVSENRISQASEVAASVPKPAREAMERLHTWVNARGKHFEGHPDRDAQAELLGAYDPGHAVSIRVDALQQVFAPAGISSTQMVRIRSAWRRAEWTRSDADHLTTVRRLGGTRRRVVEVCWSSWVAMSRLDDPTPPPQPRSAPDPDPGPSRRPAHETGAGTGGAMEGPATGKVAGPPSNAGERGVTTKVAS